MAHGTDRVRLAVLALCGCLAPALVLAQERARIDLNGEWQFRLDPSASGEAERCHSPGVPFPDTIRVPGCWQAQGFGEPAGNLRNHYSGHAWYRRTLSIPAAWRGKIVMLRVGGVTRRAVVFVNGTRAGEHDGFSTPFSLDISDALRPGADNTIAFLVANPGTAVTESPDAQKANDPTGMFNYIGNWGGIHGNVALEAIEPEWIDEVAVEPEVANRRVRFRLAIRSRESGPAHPARVEVEVDGRRASATLSVQPGRGAQADVTLAMPGARLWSPDDPHLYTASIRLFSHGRQRDRIEQRFGMREIAARGSVLLLNGKPLYLRGFGDDNIEVLTGVPPASKQDYLERLRLARSFGFNAVRFHSMTPMREYFEAADEAGILVMAELPVAYTMYLLPHGDFLRKELERILRLHRNHPSFLSLAFGNEFNLRWLKTEQERQTFRETVEEFYRVGKSIDPHRLLLSNDGYVMRPTDMVSLFRDPPGDVPAVRHEFGNYYCSLPDISLIDRFTGVLVPSWLEEKKRWVERSALLELYPTLLRNSQRLLHLGHKYQIERARMLREFTGYHYWLIVDFPGGTGEGDSWEEGWFDYFWRPKGVTPEQGRELNAAVLLIAGAGVNDRTMWNGARKRIPVYVSNYGEADIESGALSWQLLENGRRVSGGEASGITAPLGEVSRIAEIEVEAPSGDSARQLELVITLRSGQATHVNRWSLWSFPRDGLLQDAGIPVTARVKWEGLRRLYPFIQNGRPDRKGLLITSVLDNKAARFLHSGGRVWLLADRAQFGRAGDAAFFPASGGALGTLVRDHPALAGFPHQGFCDLQFYNLLEGAWNFPLDNWPRELSPIVGGVRTTSSFLSKRKDLSKAGYVFEAKAWEGRLLVTTLRLRDHLDEAYPEAVYLFDRLLRYVAGPAFDPRVEVGEEHLRRLLVR